MTERNEPCPCGSKIKYKNCFERELETCALYIEQRKKGMLIQHKEKDDKVFYFFKEVLDDIGSVFVHNDSGKELVSSRVQVVIVFTLIDIVASYWFAYHGRTGTPTQRFTEWMNKYCFIPGNKEFSNSAYTKPNGERLFELRNSLVHFFGLASKKDALHNFAIAPNDDKWVTVTEKFTKVLKKKDRIFLSSKAKDFMT